MRRMRLLLAAMLRSSILALAFTAFLSHVAFGAEIENSAAPQVSKEIPDLGTADEYVNGAPGIDAYATGIALLGITVIDGTARLKDGRTVRGARVCSVSAGAGATAGLRDEEVGKAGLLTAGFLMAGVFFPPAVFGAIAVHELGIGESYDLIIAVDGEPTHNVLELREALIPVTAGELLYLVVVRRGRRDYIVVPL
jgi:hypothetical protein